MYAHDTAKILKSFNDLYLLFPFFIGIETNFKAAFKCRLFSFQLHFELLIVYNSQQGPLLPSFGIALGGVFLAGELFLVLELGT